MIVMTIVALWGQVDLSVCLGEVNDVLVTGNLNGSLIAGRAPGRAAFSARCGRNFVDEVPYLGHLPDSAEGRRE
jgi:hypothetical protein